jgi:hypothetical protein
MGLATEIRAALSRMKPEDRRAAIQTAMTEGDDATIAAVLSGPEFLTGVGKAERAARLGQWQQKHRAAELDQRERLAKAQAALNHAGVLAIAYCHGLTDAEIVAQAQASAKAAADAIKQATTS